MIIVNARIQATAETVEALKDAILTMQNATLKEEGCEDYSFCVELADPGAIRVVECWTTRDALNAHFQTPHMATFLAVMQQHTLGETDAHFYEATEIEMSL